MRIADLTQGQSVGTRKDLGVDAQGMNLEMRGGNYQMDKEGNYIPIQGKKKQSHRGIEETGAWDTCKCDLLGNRGECLRE